MCQGCRFPLRSGEITQHKLSAANYSQAILLQFDCRRFSPTTDASSFCFCSQSARRAPTPEQETELQRPLQASVARPTHSDSVVFCFWHLIEGLKGHVKVSQKSYTRIYTNREKPSFWEKKDFLLGPSLGVSLAQRQDLFRGVEVGQPSGLTLRPCSTER